MRLHFGHCIGCDQPIRPPYLSHERIRDDRSDYRFIGYGILFALVAVLGFAKVVGL